jgi:hypothetical protein
MRRRNANTYEPLVTAKNPSEKYAHYLAWAYKARPGERIPYRDIVKAALGVQNITNTRRDSIKRSFSHIKKILRVKYDLGWDANEDGIHLLDHPDEIAAIGAADGIQQMAAGQKRVTEQVELADRRGGIEACSDTDLGREAARFLAKAKAVTRVALPKPEGIRGLLIAAIEP